MSNTKTALITGASAGLGKEFAKQLASAGYQLVLVARRKEKLDEVAAEIHAAHGVAVSTIAVDLNDTGSPQKIFDEVSAAGQHIDFLVNNAGAAGCDLIQDRDWQVQQDFFQLMMLSVALGFPGSAVVITAPAKPIWSPCRKTCPLPCTAAVSMSAPCVPDTYTQTFIAQRGLWI